MAVVALFAVFLARDAGSCGLKMCSGDIWRWDYEHGSAAGIHQYERGARHDAD